MVVVRQALNITGRTFSKIEKCNKILLDSTDNQVRVVVEMYFFLICFITILFCHQILNYV